MNSNTHHSGAWVSFTYASFAVAAGMMAFGVLFMPLDLWSKAYFAMASLMLVQSSVTVTKTVRDVHESQSFASRIEDARTERLLATAHKE